MGFNKIIMLFTSSGKRNVNVWVLLSFF